MLTWRLIKVQGANAATNSIRAVEFPYRRGEELPRSHRRGPWIIHKRRLHSQRLQITLINELELLPSPWIGLSVPVSPISAFAVCILVTHLEQAKVTTVGVKMIWSSWVLG